MLRSKKKVIWHKRPARRRFKPAPRFTKIQLFRRICKALYRDHLMITKRPAQKTINCFKNILVRLQKPAVAVKRPPLKQQTMVVKKAARKQIPPILHSLCGVLGIDYKTAEGNKLLNKYADFYIPTAKKAKVVEKAITEQKVNNTNRDIKKEHSIISAEPSKKTAKFNAGQHSKNWIDPKVWRKMPQKERDEFLIKTGKRPRKQEHAK